MYWMQDDTAGLAEPKSARKELRMKPSVAERIDAAAQAVGMSVTEFVTAAAYDRAREVERSQIVTTLPEAQFTAFATAARAPGRRIPGLAEAAEQTAGLLKDG